MGRERYSPFQRRQRAASRIALYGSLALMALAAWAGSAFARAIVADVPLKPPEWAGTDFEAIPAVSLLQGYLRVDTSQPDPNEVAGARYLAALFEEAGIPTHLEILGEGHANLWAILEGEDPRALVLHNHIDTDPIFFPDDWRHDPFEARIDGEWLYGRGAYDMKSVAIAQALALIDLHQRQVPLRRSLIFLATGSEEIGSDYGMRWILSEHPELVARFWSVLTEGGAVETRTSLDTALVKYWGIEFAQKRYVDVTLCSPSKERLEALHEDLVAQFNQLSYPLLFDPEVETFLESYGPTRDHPIVPSFLEAPTLVSLDPSRYRRVPLFLRSLLRDEAPPAEIRPSEGGGYELSFKLHLLHDTDPEEALDRLLPEWMIRGLSMAVHDEGGAAHGSPLDHPLYLEITSLLSERYPETPIGPLFLPWTATDSRFVRAAGIPSYGFAPFPVLTPETHRVGQVNERVSLPVYLEGVDLYLELVHRMVADTQ